jgi:hypothetical protein
MSPVWARMMHVATGPTPELSEPGENLRHGLCHGSPGRLQRRVEMSHVTDQITGVGLSSALHRRVRTDGEMAPHGPGGEHGAVRGLENRTGQGGVVDEHGDERTGHDGVA